MNTEQIKRNQEWFMWLNQHEDIQNTGRLKRKESRMIDGEYVDTYCALGGACLISGIGDFNLGGLTYTIGNREKNSNDKSGYVPDEILEYYGWDATFVAHTMTNNDFAGCKFGEIAAIAEYELGLDN